MSKLHKSDGPRIADLGFHGKFGRPVLVLGALLMVVALAAGCTVVEELTTTTATPPQEATTSTLPDETSTTLAEMTTTSEPAETTTSEADETTTTVEVAEATTSTETAVTLALADTTTTTAPPVMEPAETSGDQSTGDQNADKNVLYQISDWSSGVNGWAAAGQWKTAGGMLVTDGTSNSFAVAPVDLTGYPDYVVELEAQIIDPKDETVVLLMARMINGVAYYGGFDGSESRMVVGYDTEEMGSAGFVLDSAWHTYRLEVRGNTIRLFLEQAEVARAVDNRALEPGTVGIYCGNGQINVRSFKVSAL